MRGGFVQMFSADESLMKALYALGTNADVAGASNEIMAAGMTEATAEDQFEKGLTSSARCSRAGATPTSRHE